MSTALRIIFMCALFMAIIALQVNMDAHSSASRYLKNNLEVALHDAALEIDDNLVSSKGQVKFDTVKGTDNLISSLKYNLHLKDGGTQFKLEPTPSSFFDSTVEVKFITFFDDLNTAIFPFNYQNPTYNINQPIFGPSVVALIEAKAPRPFLGENHTIRRLVVYEYKK